MVFTTGYLGKLEQTANSACRTIFLKALTVYFSIIFTVRNSCACILITSENSAYRSEITISRRHGSAFDYTVAYRSVRSISNNTNTVFFPAGHAYFDIFESETGYKRSAFKLSNKPHIAIVGLERFFDSVVEYGMTVAVQFSRK